MKKVVFLISVFSLLTSCSPISYEIYGTIKGTVYDAETVEPLAGVSISLSPSGVNTLTAADGTFEIYDLSADQYTVSVTKKGYQADSKQVMLYDGETQDLTFLLNLTQ